MKSLYLIKVKRVHGHKKEFLKTLNENQIKLYEKGEGMYHDDVRFWGTTRDDIIVSDYYWLVYGDNTEEAIKLAKKRSNWDEFKELTCVGKCDKSGCLSWGDFVPCNDLCLEDFK